MHIFHIAVTKREPVLSGGEVSMISLVLYLKKRKCISTIVTTPMGKRCFEDAGLLEDRVYIRYIVNSLTDTEATWHVFFSWIITTIKSISTLRFLDIPPKSQVLCHSYFFPDVIVASIIRNVLSLRCVVYWYHMKPPRLFYGFDGEFTGSPTLPSIRGMFYVLNDFFFRRMVQTGDVVMTVNTYCESYLSRILPHAHIYRLIHFGGGAEHDSRLTSKKYDIVWVGRFHSQKGLRHLIDVLVRIKSTIRRMRVLIIGDGDEKSKTNLSRMIIQNNLTDTVTRVGAVTEPAAYLKYLRSSRVYISTSIYEGFGLANLEAMKQGVPVVSYDLPPYEPLKEGMITIPILQNEKFANEILKLLQQKRYYMLQANRARAISHKFQWDRMGQEIVAIFQYVQK